MSKLTEYREKLNLTQEELAQKSGVSVRTTQRIEAGAKLKGHSLNVLSNVLKVSREELTGEKNETSFNYKLIKLINLSSLPFVVIPLVNIILPLVLMYAKKEVNSITKQIVSIQILWTVISFAAFFLFIFIKNWLSLSNQLTLVVLMLSILVNLYIIIRNTVEIDKYNKLHIKLNFSFI